MNRKLSTLLIGFVALTCSTLSSAQQGESTTPNSNQQDSDVQDFLKAYGSRPPAVEQPAVNPSASQGQTPSIQYAPEPQQTTPPAEPYKSLHEKSVWERLKVPPRDVPPPAPPAETSDQLQSNQQSTDQTKDQTPKTSDHYNIFR